MSLYVVRDKSDDGRWRFYRESGEQISDMDWEDKPSKMNMVEALADEHSGASILGNPDARWEYTEIVTGRVSYHGSDEQVPWSGE